MNSLLIIPKNSFQKLYLYNIINFWKKLFLKNNLNEPKINNLNLLEFLYMEKAKEQMSNITSYMLKQYSINNLFNLKLLLKNKNIKSENDIYLSLSELNKINDEKIYKKIFISIIENKLYQFFLSINNLVNNDGFNNDNNNIEYMNIIIKMITYDEIIKIIKQFKLNNLLKIINELIGKNRMNDFLKIQNYINNTFALELKFELFLDDDQIKKYESNEITEALNQLIETLYEYEIKEKEHKINIYLNIIDIYNQVIRNSFINEQNNLNNFNKIFVNDVFILSNINIKQNKGDKIINLINFFKNNFKIDINDINKNINDFKDFQIINNFFEMEDYINQNIQFEFDINRYINNKSNKVEYLPIYSNKMHVHMLNKSKIDYSGRENNEISTCYIYDYRIEENYLSIRQEDSIKNENNIQNSNMNKEENNNMFGNITGKLFNLINDD